MGMSVALMMRIALMTLELAGPSSRRSPAIATLSAGPLRRRRRRRRRRRAAKPPMMICASLWLRLHFSSYSSKHSGKKGDS
uniref:Secreted protein n=1 Tax=Arundo donax TaxID=35708 RepID=A0A0A9AIC9_ARUDO